MSRNEMEVKEALNFAQRADMQAVLTLTTSGDTSTGGDFGTVTEGDAMDSSQIRDVLLHNTGSNDLHYIAGTSAPEATRNGKKILAGQAIPMNGIMFTFFAIITAVNGNNSTLEIYALGVDGV